MKQTYKQKVSSHIVVFGVAFLASLFQLSTSAQSDTLRPKEDIVIIKDYVPTVVNANRKKEVPEFQDTTIKSPDVAYPMMKKQVPTSFEVSPIHAARMKGEPLSKLYPGYLKMGFGSSLTTELDAYYGDLRSRNRNWQIGLNHFMTLGEIQDVGFSGMGLNKCDASYTRFNKESKIGGSVAYNYNWVHYYGFEPNEKPEFTKDSTLQTFNNFSSAVNWKTFYKDSSKVNYTSSLIYGFNTWKTGNSEQSIVGNFGGSKVINGEKLVVDSKVDFNRSLNVNDTLTNTIVDIYPHVLSSGEKWKIDLGIGIVTEVTNVAKFRFYPRVYMKYNLVKEVIIPFAGINGSLERNSLIAMSNINPYLNENVSVFNTNKKYQIYGGIRGAISSTWSFSVKASKSINDDMGLFVADTSSGLTHTYTLVKDSMGIFQMTGELSYQKFEKLKIILRGDLFEYDMTYEAFSWHLPLYQATATAKYDLQDKFVVSADFFLISSRSGRAFSGDLENKVGSGIYKDPLKQVVDLNLGVEYRYTKNLAAYINFRNLASMKYYRWQNYPVQRFVVLGGLSFRF